MSFMEQQIEYGTWLQVDTTNGIECIPSILFDKEWVRQILENDDPDPDHDAMEILYGLLSGFMSSVPYSAELIDGYGARMSAPGYMDCTEWSVFSDRMAAQEYLTEMYGDEDEDEDKDEDESDEEEQ